MGAGVGLMVGSGVDNRSVSMEVGPLVVDATVGEEVTGDEVGLTDGDFEGVDDGESVLMDTEGDEVGASDELFEAGLDVSMTGASNKNDDTPA